MCHWERVDKDVLTEAIDWCGGWDRIVEGARVLLKPNLTFPFYKPGVTTPPDAIRALTELLLERGAQVTICEGCAGLDAFSIWDAFAEHGVMALRDEYGINVVDLCREPVIYRSFGSKPAGQKVPIPKILEEANVFISMPVVKVHAMTTVSLALKNQWGMIATKKRLLFHSAINDILIGLNALLPSPLVVCDGRTVLDGHGPGFGTSRPGGFLAVGNHPGAFDFALCYLMGFDPMRVAHIRTGIKAGAIPHSLAEIALNRNPADLIPFKFTLRRTLQDYIALAGFNSWLLCKLLYDSPLGNFLHKLLYAVKGNPLQEAMEAVALQAPAQGAGKITAEI